MPFVKVTIPENIENITRPVVMGIVSDLKSITNIDPSTRIIFPGDTGKMQQQGMAIDDPSRQVRLSSESYVYIEVEQDDDPQYMASTAVNFPEYNPFFRDPQVHVSLFPLYATTNVKINFKFQSRSRTDIVRWRDNIRMRLSGMRDIHLHSVAYHYNIPDAFLVLLAAVYQNKQRLLQSPQTLKEYIASNISTRARIVTDLVGKDLELSIAETQMRIVGRYTFDSMPEKPERIADEAVWTGSFTYEFTYERPTMVAARYPVTVFNQVLPSAFIGFWNTDLDDDLNKKSYSYSIGALSNFESQEEPKRYINFKAFHQLPSFDDFNPQTVASGTVGLFNALCQVDETDFVTLMNLGDLGDLAIDQDILSFIIAQELPYLPKLYMSMLNLSLYENYTLMRTDTLQILPDLTIQSKTPLDPKNFYHVRFSILTDLSLVNFNAFLRLQNYPAALVKMISAVNSAIRNNPYLQSLQELPTVNSADFSLLFAKMLGLRNVGKTGTSALLNDPFASIRGQALELFRNNSTRMNTVQSSYILSERKG